jgi:hypothetical protein
MPNRHTQAGDVESRRFLRKFCRGAVDPERRARIAGNDLLVHGRSYCANWDTLRVDTSTHQRNSQKMWPAQELPSTDAKGGAPVIKRGGWWLVGASALFWLAWALMPGVGVTDPAQIFALVGSQRSLVAASVAIQLVSAVLYIPALAGIAAVLQLNREPFLRWGAMLLVAGAMGSAADAVLHLLAYAMTAPNIDEVSMIPVMAFMQGPGLIVLAPLLLGFFIGGAAISIGLGRLGIASRWNGWLHGIAIIVAFVGGLAAAARLLPARAVGLLFLAMISIAQAWAGVAIESADLEASVRPPLRDSPRGDGRT